jgi:hypothetical protein
MVMRCHRRQHPECYGRGEEIGPPMLPPDLYDRGESYSGIGLNREGPVPEPAMGNGERLPPPEFG